MESTDLVTVITKDHREVEAIFAELESGNISTKQRRDLADHMTAELVRHAVAEEMYMYPAIREHLPDGDKLADHEIEEHGEVEKLLQDLDGMDAADPKFDEILTKLIADVRHHVQEEESDILPKLQTACGADRMRELGEQVQRAKSVAPTRPHPSAPDTPPANKLLAPGTGLVDRLRDALSGRST
jgi:hemerythrin superfamily protein